MLAHRYMPREEYDAHSRRRRQVSPYLRLKGKRGTPSTYGEQVEHERKGVE